MAELDDLSDARRTLIARLALGGATVLFVAAAALLLVNGPDQVVGRFDTTGQPTRYDDTVSFVLGLSATAAALVALFAGLPLLMRKSIAFVNIPRRELWDTPRRRPILARRVGADLMLIGAVTVLLLAAMLVLSGLGGLGVALPGWIFAVLIVGYLVATMLIILPMLTGRRYDPTLLPE